MMIYFDRFIKSTSWGNSTLIRSQPFYPCVTHLTAWLQKKGKKGNLFIYVVVCDMSSVPKYNHFCLWSALNKCHCFVLPECRCCAMTVISMLIYCCVILSHAMLHVVPSLAEDGNHCVNYHLKYDYGLLKLNWIQLFCWNNLWMLNHNTLSWLSVSIIALLR